MSRSDSYLKMIQLNNKISEKELDKKSLIRHFSVLMAYDFHLTPDKELKLIEVNTNASSFLVSDTVEKAHDINTNGIEQLKANFTEEWGRFSNNISPPNYTLIIDNNIKQQKMYIEFLMYKDLFHSWNWPCSLHETNELKSKPDGTLTDSHGKAVNMIYNRSTDFYLEQSPDLKNAFWNQKVCLSPQPMEYFLLADKTRLCEWSDPAFLNSLDLSSSKKEFILGVIPTTGVVNMSNKNDLWKNKKRFFFKPTRGYGGKSVYKGQSISHKTFERILKTPCIYQRHVPAPEFTDHFGETWKYDIRAYAYQGKVLKTTARVYRGQLTNFRESQSGFATLIFN